MPLGVSLVQLRIKDMDEKGLQTEIRRANDACAVHGCQVSVNDIGARQSRKAATSSILVKGIWLPPMLTMKYVGLKLGLSIHDRTELETAPVAEPE
ncbi:thiamine phosphate synthase [Mesorhizobium sp. M0659]|nr:MULTISPECIES: thiamine phosphate synthase [unclassified Mesorhizobium]ESZ32949.1 hypothetical protein X731_31650 [Mesorhizobium sp. L2C054A000]WJI50427.1 thiamine phosphate synthase [Mesorhizobium sp. C089B]